MTMDIIKDSVYYGDTDIEFEVKQRPRKTLEISVLPDQRVSVIAPLNTSQNSLRDQVLKKADWILKQKRYFARFSPPQPDREFVLGESHKYLGKQYRLKFVIGGKKNIYLKGDYLFIGGTKDSVVIEKMLTGWYKIEAKQLIAELVETHWKKMTFNMPTPIFYVRKLHKRWGSCTPRGILLFNYELIQAPKNCIEYVVIHELCHLYEPNHNSKFFSLLKEYCPDWKDRKNRLEGWT